AGRHLHALAHNLDPRPVEPRRRRRSIGAQRARGRAPWSDASVDADLMTLADRVTRRMRKAGRRGRTVVLRLRFDDYTRATRSRTLPGTTSSTERVLTTARALVAEALPTMRQRGLTLVGVSVANLDDDAQLVLPFDRNEELDTAVDLVRERYGSDAIVRAAVIGNVRSWST
ncbi:MAG: DNA polymerase IV, partial [Acidobacteriota bacterium]|nr:DNA polymerase IV [Acidobacteriota bacterium]